MPSRIAPSLLAFLLLCPWTAVGQETTGTIAGHIVDPQGLPVPAATITITGARGTRTVTSDGRGRFTMPFLPPGSYSMQVELQGFKTARRGDISVALGKTTELPVTLEVGPLSESVQVKSAPDLIKPADTTTGANLTTELIQSVPVGRTRQRRAVPGAGREQLGHGGRANPSIARRQRSRQPVRHRRRQRHQPGLRRARVVLDRLRIARQRDAVRLHPGSPGEDRRLRGRVRPGDRRRRQRRHEERNATRCGDRSSAIPRPTGSKPDGSSSSRSTAACRPNRPRVVDGGVEGGFPVVKNQLFFFGAFDPGREVHDAPGARRTSRCSASATSIGCATLETVLGQGHVAAVAARTGSTPRSSAIRRPATTARSARRALLVTRHRRRSARSSTAATTRPSATTARFGTLAARRHDSRAR